MATQDVTELEYEKSLVSGQQLKSCMPVWLENTSSLYISLSHCLPSLQMYGQYSELQKFAREFAAKSSYRRDHKKKPLTIEEAKRRKSRPWSKFGLAGWVSGLVVSCDFHVTCRGVELRFYEHSPVHHRLVLHFDSRDSDGCA